MSTKSLSDYLRMMQQAEDESEMSDEGEIEEDTESESGIDDDILVDGDSLVDDEEDFELESDIDGDLDESVDVVEESESLEEGFENDILSAINTGDFWSSTVGFLSYAKESLATFRDLLQRGNLDEFITDEGQYECQDTDYMIVGITVEQGLIAVVKCVDQNGQSRNGLFYIKEGSIEFIKFI